MEGRGAVRGLPTLVVPAILKRVSCGRNHGAGPGVNLEREAWNDGWVGYREGRLGGLGGRPRGGVQAVVQERRPQLLMPVGGHRAVGRLHVLRPLRLGLLDASSTPGSGLSVGLATGLAGTLGRSR